MRISLCLLSLVSALAFMGCAREKYMEELNEPAVASTPAAMPTTDASSATKKAVIPKPVEALNAKVSSANANLKFVVLTFPIGQMATINQRLNVYRAGVKVGELVVTGPQRDENIIADVVGGEAQAGDEVRE